MRTDRLIAAAAGVVALWSVAAQAQPPGTPAALVEDVIGAPPGVEFMDYLAAGRKIILGPKDGLTLSYLASCVRETILGGTVTIGTEYSTVEGGMATREKAQCDAGKLTLTLAQAETAGATVVRSLKPPQGVEAQVTLYGRAPLVTGPAGAVLTVERLDEPGDRLEAKLSARGAHDFARANADLVAGGVYRAAINGKAIIFRIHPSAQPGATAAAGRLLRFSAEP